MKNGDLIIDHNDKQWVIYDINVNAFNENMIYVTDFRSQNVLHILVSIEIKEVVPKPENVEFLGFHRRIKRLADVKEYL